MAFELGIIIMIWVDTSHCAAWTLKVSVDPIPQGRSDLVVVGCDNCEPDQDLARVSRSHCNVNEGHLLQGMNRTLIGGAKPGPKIYKYDLLSD